MEKTMNMNVMPVAPTPTWKIERPPGHDGSAMVRRKEVREYVHAWWQDCLHHGFQCDPEYLPAMVEGYDYAGRGLWKEWMAVHALQCSFLHWVEDMGIERIDLIQMTLVQFGMYFLAVDKVHTKKRQRVILKNTSDVRLSYKTWNRVILFDILPAHREGFRK